MCTVVFIPTKESLLFASVRDESPLRPKAMAPKLFTSTETSFLAPQDVMAGGTWLGAGQSNTLVILLNGAFKKHTQQKSYRLSRGLIVSEMLATLSPLSCWEKTDLNNIEAFTLIVWENGQLLQLVWDEEQKHKLKIDASKPQIWSSSTLYSDEAKLQRHKWFYEWINTKPIISGNNLLEFFRSVSDSNNGFIMDRENKVRSVSFTSIAYNQSHFIQMDYHDFLTNSFSSNTMRLQETINGQFK